MNEFSSFEMTPVSVSIINLLSVLPAIQNYIYLYKPEKSLTFQFKVNIVASCCEFEIGLW